MQSHFSGGWVGIVTLVMVAIMMIAATGDLTMREAGRLGGAATRDQYGTAHYSEIGRKGGATTMERYGSEHYIEAGRKGGEACAARHGTEHYQRIGRKGGDKMREMIDKGKAAIAREEVRGLAADSTA